MIWGELVNRVRSLHVELLDQFSVQPRTFLQDIELSCEDFPYPSPTGNFGEWDPAPLPEQILEAVEFHPVERVLVEGPLMPIQEVRMDSDQWDALFKAIVRLELEWLKKLQLHSPEKFAWLDQSLQSKFLQLKKQSGAIGLKVV